MTTGYPLPTLRVGFRQGSPRKTSKLQRAAGSRPHCPARMPDATCGLPQMGQNVGSRGRSPFRAWLLRECSNALPMRWQLAVSKTVERASLTAGAFWAGGEVLFRAWLLRECSNALPMRWQLAVSKTVERASLTAGALGHGGAGPAQRLPLKYINIFY